MADKRTEVVVTCNVQQPQAAVKVLKKALDDLKKSYGELSDEQKASSEKGKKIYQDIKDLSAAIKEGEGNIKRVDNVMMKLSSSTLSQLNSALREIKKSMRTASEDGGRMDELREKFNAISRQVKVLQGEYINIGKHMGELSQQTDAWVARAISQQKNLVAQTKKGSEEYQNQKLILSQLQTEQANRAFAVAFNGENSAGSVSANQLRQARSNIVSFRDSVGAEDLNLGDDNNVSNLENCNAALSSIDQQLDAINGKAAKTKEETERVEKSVLQLSDEVEEIALDPKKFSPKEIKDKLDEAKKHLDSMLQSDPERSRLVNGTRRLQQALDGVDKELINVGALLKPNNLRAASLDTLKKAASQLEREMAQLGRNTKEFSDKRSQLEKLRAEVERTTGAVNKQGSAWKKTFQSVTSYIGVTMVIGKIQQMFTNLVKLNLKFSDQLANIRKVSGLAMDDINNLSERLAKIDTRSTIEELNNIAYAGAKLGIAKYGVEGLEGFVKASNQVNVALKEDLGADALTALSKITEVMGLIPKMGVEKSMLATGSAMFQLSASSTATAGNIVEFAKRLTGMARTAGITTDQLLALGSAADSMYLMPEVASTAFNKFISALQTKHNLIENELNISPGTISKLYESGKIVDAMVLVFQKMKEQGNMNALQGVFKDLGSDGARLVNVMVTMSKNVDMLKEHLYTSEEAFEDAMAVTNEYNIQQETAQALMERASNVWEKAFVNPAGVDNVKALAQRWFDLSKTLTESNIFMGQFKFAINGVLLIVEALIVLLPTLIQFFLFKGAVTAVLNLCSGLKTLYESLFAATAAQKGLNTAMKANLFGLVASLIATAVVYLLDYGDAADSSADNQKKLNSYLEEAAANYDKESRKLESYLKVLQDSNTSASERERILKKFNHEYQPYLTKLGIEVNSVDSLKKHYAELNDEIRKKMYFQMKERAYDDKLGDASSALGNATMDYSRYVNGGDSKVGAGFDTRYVKSQAEAGKNAVQIYRQMIEASYGGGGVWSGYDGAYIPKGGSGSIKDDKLLGYIKNMINAIRGYDSTKKEIDKAFDPIIGDYNPFKEDSLGTLENEAPDKDAIKAEKQRKNEQRKAWRDELKQAQDEAKAVMDNIRNFYQRQITEVMKTANEQNWDETLLSAATDAITARQNLAMSNARKGIAGIKSEWASFKLSMANDLLEKSDDVGFNESKVLLDNVLQSNLSSLHLTIKKLAHNLGMPGNAATDAIWKNASLNEKSNESAKLRHRKAINAQLLEDNYTGKVDNDYTQSMENLGFFDLNENQSNMLLAGGDKAKKLLEKRAIEIEMVLRNAREHISDLYSIEDVNFPGDRNKLLSILFGPNFNEDDSELKGVFNAYLDKMKLFYDELLKYSDDYTEALRKARERQKKILDFRWNDSDKHKNNENAQNAMELASSGVAQQLKLPHGNSDMSLPYKDQYGSKQFVSSMGKDPEVEAYRLKMEAAQAYYDFLDKNHAEQELVRDAEQEALKAQMEYAKAVASQINQRMTDMFALTQPIEDFGSAVGTAFATMTEDAEAGRKAMKAAIGDMINGFLKQTVTMTQEYIKRRIMQQMNDRLTAIQIKKSSKQQIDMETDKQRDVTKSMDDGGNEQSKMAMDIGKDMLSQEARAAKKRLRQEEQTQDQMVKTQELGGEAQKVLNVDVKNDIQQATESIGNQTLQTQQTQTQAEVQTESAKTQANTTMGIAGGAAKIIGSLGWWGIPLVAVITALLNGLLSFAMSKVSSLFGGGGDSGSDAGPSSKLVSGMLTYDSGNVQAFKGIEDGRSYPVVGNDGNVYAAKDGGELSTGLVRDPITTLVNGQPALVAERGPEMVIGRETTAALMMARPDILTEIVRFDRMRSGRTFRAFDEGNVAEFSVSNAQGVSSDDMAQLRSTLDSLSVVITELQRKGVHVNKYGRGGIAESAEDGRNFMKRNSGSRLWSGK